MKVKSNRLQVESYRMKVKSNRLKVKSYRLIIEINRLQEEYFRLNTNSDGFVFMNDHIFI